MSRRVVQAADEPPQTNTETPRANYRYLCDRYLVYVSTYFCSLAVRGWSQVPDWQATILYEAGCTDTLGCISIKKPEAKSLFCVTALFCQSPKDVREVAVLVQADGSSPGQAQSQTQPLPTPQVSAQAVAPVLASLLAQTLQ